MGTYTFCSLTCPQVSEQKVYVPICSQVYVPICFQKMYVPDCFQMFHETYVKREGMIVKSAKNRPNYFPFRNRRL